MTDANKPVWLITGANKGLGLAVARDALDRGFRVVAGARRVEQIHTVLDAGANLLPVALDITRDDQVAAAVKAACPGSIRPNRCPD